MKSFEELKNENRLLKEYSKSLEKENEAKNVQTSMLYKRIEDLTSQNDKMRNSYIEYNQKVKAFERQLNEKNDFVQSYRNDKLQLDKKVQELLFNIEEMKKQQEQKQLERQQYIESLRQNVIQNQNYSSEKNELLQYIQSLQKQISSQNTKIIDIQQKKRKYSKRIKQLEESNNEFKQALQKTNTMNQASFNKLDFEKLVKDNNQLIEKLRSLQKEKNLYYTQLKSVSPIKERKNDQSRRRTLDGQSSRVSQMSNHKKEHYTMMQQKINAIKTENQQIKANLAIR